LMLHDFLAGPRHAANALMNRMRIHGFKNFQNDLEGPTSRPEAVRPRPRSARSKALNASSAGPPWKAGTQLSCLDLSSWSGPFEHRATKSKPLHLVRVMTDDREHQLWVAACPRKKAIELVLNAIPEGWTAALLPSRLKPRELKALNLSPGEVREITRHRDLPPRTN
jgi:hypothetical protein